MKYYGIQYNAILLKKKLNEDFFLSDSFKGTVGNFGSPPMGPSPKATFGSYVCLTEVSAKRTFLSCLSATCLGGVAGTEISKQPSPELLANPAGGNTSGGTFDGVP